jgi:hypothetical protein
MGLGTETHAVGIIRGTKSTQFHRTSSGESAHLLNYKPNYIYTDRLISNFIYFFFFNWKKIDLEKIQVDDDAGIVIPRIICPLERKRALALERLVRQMDISWKNSIKCYLKIRDYVLSYQ